MTEGTAAQPAALAEGPHAEGSGLLLGFIGVAVFSLTLPVTRLAMADSDPGLSPEGIGTVGMLVNFAITMTVSRFTPEPPAHVQVLVDLIRIPRGAGEAHEISA
jgi:cation/acetate symporter